MKHWHKACRWWVLTLDDKIRRNILDNFLGKAYNANCGIDTVVMGL